MDTILIELGAIVVLTTVCMVFFWTTSYRSYSMDPYAACYGICLIGFVANEFMMVTSNLTA